METKTLHAIQVLSKIGKIFSKIVMICCIVGFGLCIAGLFGVAAGGEILKLGGVTIKEIIGNTAGLSEGTTLRRDGDWDGPLPAPGGPRGLCRTLFWP